MGHYEDDYEARYHQERRLKSIAEYAQVGKEISSQGFDIPKFYQTVDEAQSGKEIGSISVKIDEQGNQISDNQYKANEVQVGGEHYRLNGKHQIWDLVVDMGWDFFQGNAISYIHRYRQKGGVDDLRKARHYLDKMIEIEEAKKLEGEKT